MFRFTEDTREGYPEMMDREFSYRQLKEVYRDVVSKEEYKCFEAWFYDMRRSALVTMEMPSESEMKEYAKECSREIVIRSDEDEERRKATPEESEKIFQLIYAGMLATRFYSHDSNRDGSPICGAMEYAIDIMIPDCNGYETVYNPIRRYWYCYRREGN